MPHQELSVIHKAHDLTLRRSYFFQPSQTAPAYSPAWSESGTRGEQMPHTSELSKIATAL